MNRARHKSLVLVLLLTAMFSPDIRAQVTITQQPQSQTLPTGASLTLTVQATGGIATSSTLCNMLNLLLLQDPDALIGPGSLTPDH